MSTPEPTDSKTSISLAKMQSITKRIMGHALFVDPLDKTNETYKHFQKRQKQIASYAASLNQISEDYAKKDKEAAQRNEDKKKAEMKLKKNTKIYKMILAEEEDKFKKKEQQIKDRIKILAQKKDKKQEEERELDRLELQKKPFEEYEKDNSVFKIGKSKIGIVNPAMIIADSRMAKLIDKNELHASIKTKVVKKMQSENLKPEEKSALEYAVEYSIGQLEGVGDTLLNGLKAKCIASGWQVNPVNGSLVYKNTANFPNLEISSILTASYRAYIKIGIASHMLGTPNATKAQLLKEAEITTLKPIPSKKRVLPKFEDSERKPEAVVNPLVMLPEFANAMKSKTVTLVTVDTPITPTVSTMVTPAEPPTSSLPAKLAPEFKRFCNTVVTNYNEGTDQKVTVEEAENKMKIITPPPWEIRKTTLGSTEITIPHDDGTTAAQQVILSAIKAAAAAHRPVRINLQDPKQIEFAIEATKKLGDIKYILSPNSNEILSEARAKDSNPKKKAHP